MGKSDNDETSYGLNKKYQPQADTDLEELAKLIKDFEDSKTKKDDNDITVYKMFEIFISFAKSVKAKFLKTDEKIKSVNDKLKKRIEELKKRIEELKQNFQDSRIEKAKRHDNSKSHFNSEENKENIPNNSQNLTQFVQQPPSSNSNINTQAKKLETVVQPSSNTSFEEKPADQVQPVRKRVQFARGLGTYTSSASQPNIAIYAIPELRWSGKIAAKDLKTAIIETHKAHKKITKNKLVAGNKELTDVTSELVKKIGDFENKKIINKIDKNISDKKASYLENGNEIVSYPEKLNNNQINLTIAKDFNGVIVIARLNDPSKHDIIYSIDGHKGIISDHPIISAENSCVFNYFNEFAEKKKISLSEDSLSIYEYEYSILTEKLVSSLVAGGMS